MAAPQWLTKEYGPFTGTVWIVVIVGGVGLGLVMRRFMTAQGGDAASSEPIGTTTQPSYGVETGSPSFVGGGGTTFNQGEIVSGVMDAIAAQQPPPATTNPEDLAANTSIGQTLAGLRAEHSRLTALMNQRALQRRQYDPNGGTAERQHYQRLQNEISEIRLARDRVTQQIATLEGQLEYAEDRK